MTEAEKRERKLIEKYADIAEKLYVSDAGGNVYAWKGFLYDFVNELTETPVDRTGGSWPK